MAIRSLILKSIVAALAIVLAGFSRADEQAKSEKAIDSMRGEKAGQERDDNGLKIKLVWCPPGFVTMEQVEQIKMPVKKGADADDDTPEDDKDDPKAAAADKARTVEKITPVRVLLSRGYWLGKYEVTQAEWKQVMETEPWKNKKSVAEGDYFPATFVSWDDAMAFCRNLTQQERQAGRLSSDWEYTLPTEAQWERACRARTETKYSFGDDESKLEQYAWCRDNTVANGEEYAHRVGNKKPNPWSLHDMHGNVWEWCRDVYAEKLPGGRDPEVIPAENTEPSERVCRGGGWDFDAAEYWSGHREAFQSVFRDFSVGFRVALSAIR